MVHFERLRPFELPILAGRASTVTSTSETHIYTKQDFQRTGLVGDEIISFKKVSVNASAGANVSRIDVEISSRIRGESSAHVFLETFDLNQAGSELGRTLKNLDVPTDLSLFVETDTMASVKATLAASATVTLQTRFEIMILARNKFFSDV